MMDALRQEEQKRLEEEFEQELGEEIEQVVRTEPATEEQKVKEAPTPAKETPAWMQLPSAYQAKPPAGMPKEDQEALTELMKVEEEKHEEGEPHLHHGLPYEPETKEEE